MRLTLDKDIVIQSWSPGELRVNDTLITNNCLIHGKQVFKHWQPARLSEMTRDDFAAAFELKPEIILLGTGATQLFPSIELITLIMQQGIAFEVMDTAAACRTFNVLNGESRSVVAALLV